MKVYKSLIGLNIAIVLLSGLIFEAKAETFNIVTNGNCQTSADGTHSQCRFPEIEVRDLESRYLSIPFETVVQSRTSRTCGLDAVSAALQIRLGTRGAVEDNFLRYEDFSIDHNRRRVLTHPHSYPLGSVSIYPGVAQIFTSIVFPKGCQITLEVKLNRIALKSKIQADEHISSLNQELVNLTRSQAALIEFRRQKQQMSADRGLMGWFKNLFIGVNRIAELEALKLHWNTLLNPLRGSIAAARQAQYRIEALDDLTDQLDDFTNLLDEAVASAATPAELNNLFDHAEREVGNFPHAQASLLFEAEYLDQMAEKLRAAQGEIHSVREYLEVQFPEGEISHPLDDEFEEAFHSEIAGPHGVIDEYLCKLSRIGRTS